MNLIEAIKSGRRIRNPNGTSESVRCWHEPERLYYDSNDIVLDDWEVEDELRVMITRTQFWETVKEALTVEGKKRQIVWPGSGTALMQEVSQGCLGELARRLGLGDP